MKHVRPFTPTPPGNILDEELQARRWSQRDLALILGRPFQTVNEIIAGKKAITAETALALSHALGPSADFWLALESRYRLDLIQAKKDHYQESAVRRRARLFSKAPVAELIKRGWIRADLSDLDATEQTVCEFLGIASIEDEPDVPFFPRKGNRNEPDTASQVAWACRVRNVASAKTPNKYSKQRLLALLKELPALSASERKTKALPDILEDVGVRLVFVTHLTGTRIDGGALWLGKAPVVALTLRYDRVDWFWFTLLHELAHILETENSLDSQLVGNDALQRVSELEERADHNAAEWLIPQHRMQSFIKMVRPYFSRSAILKFADSLNVHPGIVVGQLQKRGEIPYSHHRNLLTRVRHLFPESKSRLETDV